MVGRYYRTSSFLHLWRVYCEDQILLLLLFTACHWTKALKSYFYQMSPLIYHPHQITFHETWQDIIWKERQHKTHCALAC